MIDSLMYIEYLPALIAFIITLVWFCVGVTIPEEAPPFMVWGAMVCVILGGASMFLLSPVAVWFVVAGQVLFSVAALAWMKRSRQFDLQVQRIQQNDSFSMGSKDRFHDEAFGK